MTRPAAPSPYSWTIPIEGCVVQVRSTTVVDGDFAIPQLSEAGDARAEVEVEGWRRAIVDRSWTWLRQVHGTDVVRVTAPGQHAGATADGAITTMLDAPIAVTTADCSPVVLVSTSGVAVVHAGWRGALGGIVETAATGLRRAGGEPVAALLGPCISASQYEFGVADLAKVAAVYGDEVRSTTNDGAPALDMAAVIGAACRAAGWPAPSATACTSDTRFFSHRVRGDLGRQTTVAWLEAAAS